MFDRTRMVPMEDDMKVAESVAAIESARQHQKHQAQAAAAQQKPATQSSTGLLVTIGVLLLAILSVVAVALKGP